MSGAMQQTEEVTVIKANTRLRQLVGTGAISSKSVSKVQKAMNDTKIDFLPEARAHLVTLREVILDASEGFHNKEKMLEEMIKPVMQLKAQASMFNYPLVSKLANIMMHFLEDIDELDKDVIQIVAAHQKTLSAVISKQMTGEGGNMGKMLISELEMAIDRYKKTHNLV